MRDTEGCLSGKPKYDTRQEAKRALSEVRRRRRESSRKRHFDRNRPIECAVYLCDICEGHHLTKWRK